MRIAAAGFEFLAAQRRQILERGRDEPTGRLEEAGGLGREGEQFLGAPVLRPEFGILDELLADAAAVVEWLDVERPEFHGFAIGISAQGGTTDNAIVDFVDEEVGD